MEEIDSETFALWIKFNSIDPGEPERSDLHMANIVAAVISTATTGTKPSVSDFLFNFWDRYDKPIVPVRVGDRVSDVLSSLGVEFTKTGG